MKLLLLILTALACILFASDARATPTLGPGAGRTVTEHVYTGTGGHGTATVRYEGLLEGKNRGSRWVSLDGETWHRDGHWKINGDDVDVMGDGTTLVGQTNKGMADREQSSGPITNLPPGQSGSWADV